MKPSGLEHRVLLVSQVRACGSSVKTRREAWLSNLERVPEGYPVIFYLVLAVVFWGLVIGVGWWLFG